MLAAWPTCGCAQVHPPVGPSPAVKVLGDVTRLGETCGIRDSGRLTRRTEVLSQVHYGQGLPSVSVARAQLKPPKVGTPFLWEALPPGNNKKTCQVYGRTVREGVQPPGSLSRSVGALGYHQSLTELFVLLGWHRHPLCLSEVSLHACVGNIMCMIWVI